MADENQTAGNSAAGPEGAGQEQGVQFGIQKLYLKDISFEAPNSPDVFQEQWQPDIQVNLNNQTERLGEDQYEVVLTVTVTAKQGEKTAFLVEVQQAGAFIIRNVTEEQLNAMTGSYCPGVLFPFARQTISDVVVHGGFPALLLNPINFDALYQQQVQQQQQQGADTPPPGEGDLTI
jgi:preprotein translocase subunit SecB